MADAEERALEAKMNEELNTRVLFERMDVETGKWLAVIKSSFKQVGDVMNYSLDGKETVAIAIIGGTVLGAGIYSRRDGARVLWGHVERALGRSPLLRERSRENSDQVKRLFPFTAKAWPFGGPPVLVPSQIGDTIGELRYQGLKATEQAVRSLGVEYGSHGKSSTGVTGSTWLFRLMHRRPYSFQPFVEAGGCTRISGIGVGPLLRPLKIRNPFLEGGVRFKSKNKIKKAKQKKREVLHKIKRIRIFAKKRKEEMNPEERLEFRLHRNRKKMDLIKQAIAKFPVQEIPPRDADMEVLTAEHLHYYKKIGYKNKNYVPVGRRGIYGGTIQNIHLHWKKHETVQVEIAGFTKDEIKVMADQLARLSGGVLIDIHRANIVILYRGRNYVQPKQLIPMKTLDKRKALALSKLQQSLKALQENDKKVENELYELRKENELRASGEFVEKAAAPKPKLEDPDEYSDWSSSDISDEDEDEYSDWSSSDAADADEDVEARISEAVDGVGDEVEVEDEVEDDDDDQHQDQDQDDSDEEAFQEFSKKDSARL